MIIELVPIHAAVDIWDKVKHQIEKTNDDLLNDEDVLNFLATGQWRLWVALENGIVVAAMTVEFFYYPRDKVCRVVTMGGERMKEWLTSDTIKNFEEWVKNEGCSYIDVYGRRGWKKVLPGYEEDCVLLRKAI
jgi:hypothetical protein